MSDGKIDYKLTVDLSKWTPEIQKAIQEVENLSKGIKPIVIPKPDMSNIEDAIKRVRDISLAYDGMMSAISKVQGIFKEFISLAGESADAQLRLKVALKNTGDATLETFQGLRNLSDELSKQTAICEDVISKNMAYALQLGITKDKLDEASKGAIGLSTAYGIDLEQAMKLVANGMQGEFGMLGRLNPLLKGNASDAEKAAIFHKMLADGFVLAEEKSKGYGGSLNALSLKIEDSKKVFGFFLRDAIKPVVQFFSEHMPFAVGIAIATLGALIIPVYTLTIAMTGLGTAVTAAFGGMNLLIPIAIGVASALGAWAFSANKVDEATKKIQDNFAKENTNLQTLILQYNLLRDKKNLTNVETKILSDTIAKLQLQYPDYLKNLNFETASHTDIDKALKETIKSLETKSRLTIAEERTNKLMREQVDLQIKGNQLQLEKEALAKKAPGSVFIEYKQKDIENNDKAIFAKSLEIQKMNELIMGNSGFQEELNRRELKAKEELTKQKIVLNEDELKKQKEAKEKELKDQEKLEREAFENRMKLIDEEAEFKRAEKGKEFENTQKLYAKEDEEAKKSNDKLLEDYNKRLADKKTEILQKIEADKDYQKAMQDVNDQISLIGKKGLERDLLELQINNQKKIKEQEETFAKMYAYIPKTMDTPQDISKGNDDARKAQEEAFSAWKIQNAIVTENEISKIKAAENEKSIQDQKVIAEAVKGGLERGIDEAFNFKRSKTEEDYNLELESIKLSSEERLQAIDKDLKSAGKSESQKKQLINERARLTNSTEKQIADLQKQRADENANQSEKILKAAFKAGIASIASLASGKAFTSVFDIVPFPLNLIVAPMAGAAAYAGIMGIGAMAGFQVGGYVGDGRNDEPGGIVHKREFVLNETTVNRIGVQNLDDLQSGKMIVAKPNFQAPQFQGTRQEDALSTVNRSIQATNMNLVENSGNNQLQTVVINNSDFVKVTSKIESTKNENKYIGRSKTTGEYKNG